MLVKLGHKLGYHRALSGAGSVRQAGTRYCATQSSCITDPIAPANPCSVTNACSFVESAPQRVQSMNALASADSTPVRAKTNVAICSAKRGKGRNTKPGGAVATVE